MLKHFEVSRIGWGLYPTQFDPPASAAFVASRMDAFAAYGSSWISVWVLNPGSKECPTIDDVEQRWAPWIPSFRSWIAAG